ncbi:MAG: response regulator transcription factor [Bacteroidota bacterium]|nr:response regulator transcription factor [Bacteroidota bacterium]
MIQIALVDDHKVLRNSLGIMIGKFDNFSILFEADNGQDFIDQLTPGFLPDIVLLDITMPVMGGVETAKWIKQHHPEIKVLVLSMVNNDMMIIGMLQFGAKGYILKHCEPAELYEAINTIYEDDFFYNDQVTAQIIQKIASPEILALNKQEISFLRWACTDLTHKEIAVEMNVSPRTVDGYRDSIFRKLQISSRVGIAIYAIKNGFVQV